MQISIQSPDPEDNDRIAGNRSFEKKIAAARHAKELDFPLTINCVLHRQNLDRIEEILELAHELGAQRLELANTQYYGWAVLNQEALMPTREQLERGEEAVQRFRERVGPKVDVLWVLPDYYEDLPKPCMGGWGRDGDGGRPERRRAALPGRVDDPGPRVRQRPRPRAGLDLERVRRVRALPRHRLDAGAVPDAARSAARRWTSAAAAARRCGSPATPRPPIPVCRFSPHHDRVVAARDAAQTDEFVYRTMKRPARV